MIDEQPYRWMLAGILILAVGISGYHRRRARVEGETIPRRREGAALIAGRLFFGLPILFALLTWLFRPGWMAWSQLPLPASLRMLGAVLGVICVPLVYWVVKSLGLNISETVLTKKEHQLVTTGPYRRLRHPLYATGLLLLTSAALMMASWFVGALTIAAGVMIRVVVIPIEEAALTAKFGDRYDDYRATTGCLMPKLHG